MFSIKQAVILLAIPFALAATVAASDIGPREEEGKQLMRPEGPVYTDISVAIRLQNDLGIKHSLAALALHPPPNWIDDHILDLTHGRGVRGVKTTNASFLLHNVSSSTEEGGRKAFIYDVGEVNGRFPPTINPDFGNWWWQGLELAIYDSISPSASSHWIEDDQASPINVLNLLTGLTPEQYDVRDMSNDEYLKLFKENQIVILERVIEQGSTKFNRVVVDIKSDTEITTTEIYGQWAEPRLSAPEELKRGYESLIVLKY
ncbi:hypothetical protein I302_102617 [Kwoniella bestiolae CBS 10118]|uniref:Uncharacterized protein n=1 Tax=Kwoniella bestiolae CBS 10118 TaxID=1296100 RepID=A0A1B9GFH1_9TREE|nr:hypothetical protein I302_01305 [Kwoniella bestiolae CBS 10118]OCF29792.1 hypothetical protein I302_01305 [Kwoniella bestiolae CBS 10118]